MITKNMQLRQKNPIAFGIVDAARNNGIAFSEPMLDLMEEMFFYPPAASLTFTHALPSYLQSAIIPTVKNELEKKYQDLLMRDFPQVSEELGKAIYTFHQVDYSMQAIDALAHQLKNGDEQGNMISHAEYEACNRILKSLPVLNPRRLALAKQVSDGLNALADEYAAFGKKYAEKFKGDVNSQDLLRDLTVFIKFAAAQKDCFPLLAENIKLTKDSVPR